MIQKDQNFEIWVTFEVAQNSGNCPKVNECPLGPVTETNGFKLDMLGPEGSIYLFVGLEVQKVGFMSKKWLLKPKIAQKVNGKHVRIGPSVTRDE